MNHRSLIASLLGLGVCAAVSLGTSQASATYYTLWIHGRAPGNTYDKTTYQDFAYWGPSSTAAGVNKRAVNWDGQSTISTSNVNIRNALDCYCTGNNWCYIAVHDAGELQIGYALALYGISARTTKNATPNSSGICGDLNGSTQTGWNIKWIDVAGGAGGGSELANLGQVFTGQPIDKDLKTTAARALYNHNVTQGRWLYRFAGAAGTLFPGSFLGQHDDAFSYHSSGGVSVMGTFCNPGDFLCPASLGTGTAGTSNGAALWSYMSVSFRDDGNAYNHYANGNWAGIIGPMRNNVVIAAK